MASKNLDTRKNETPSAFDRFFDDDFLSPNWPSVSSASSLLANVRETDNGYAITADVPGIPKELVNIQVTGNRLTIRAEHREENGEKSSGGYSQRYRSFHQSFTLPGDADGEKIEAHCENGQLEVWVPKTAPAASGRKVEVQSGKKGFLDRFFKKADDKKSADTH